MARFFLCFILSASFLFFDISHLFADSINAQYIQSSILSLLNKQDSSISSIGSGGRVYFNPEAVLSTEKGIFLKTDSGDYLQIPLLYSGEQGSYVILEEVGSTVYPIIRCINCNLPFSPTVFNRGKCPKCGTQN